MCARCLYPVAVFHCWIVVSDMCYLDTEQSNIIHAIAARNGAPIIIRAVNETLLSYSMIIHHIVSGRSNDDVF